MLSALAHFPGVTPGQACQTSLKAGRATVLLQDLFWDPVLLLSTGWHKPLRREQEWNRRVNVLLHSHCVFCKDSLDVDVFMYWVSSLHVKLVLIIQKEKNVTCSLNIRELLIVLLSSLHSCVFVQAHWVYNPSSYQTRRLLAPATRRHRLPEHPKRQLQPQCPLQATARMPNGGEKTVPMFFFFFLTVVFVSVCYLRANPYGNSQFRGI